MYVCVLLSVQVRVLNFSTGYWEVNLKVEDFSLKLKKDVCFLIFYVYMY